MNAKDFQTAADQFLMGLKRSAATIRAYRADLSHLQSSTLSLILAKWRNKVCLTCAGTDDAGF